MFTLYARPGYGSATVEALLAHTNIAHEVIDVEREKDGTAPDWYLKLNPRGEIPTLRLPDDSLMTESAAMMIYLADLFPDKKLAPAPTSPHRPAYLRAIVYLAVAPYMSDLRLYYPHRYSTDLAHADAIKSKAAESLDWDLDVFAKNLGAGPFVLGPSMSAADIYASVLLSWAPDVGALFTRHPNLKRLYDGVAAYPEIRKVWDRNGMP